jgi:uncharacterized tellurite resistance protein B-like protein
MLDAVKAFFNRTMAPAERGGGGSEAGAGPESANDGVRLAACALLVELAHADGEFTDAERAHIEGALVRHFDAAPHEVRELIALAEEENRRAVDHFQFTRLIASSYDLGQKMVLAEVMWGLVQSDGTIAEHEAYLVRKISNLLDLEPGYLYAAKKRAGAP